MDIRSCDECVNARTRGTGEGVGCAFYVLLSRATKCSYCNLTALGRHCLNRCEVPFRGNRKTCFDNVDTEFLQLRSHPHLLIKVHRTAGRLFAVAQGRIENHDSLLWHGCPSRGQAQTMLKFATMEVKVIIFI